MTVPVRRHGTCGRALKPALLLCRAILAVALALPLPTASAADAPWELAGQFADGALWRARVPRQWNGVLLLYSHGYSPRVQPPQLAPPGLESWLLDHGYALAASSYATGGWAVAEAVPDQRLTVATFTARVARPYLSIGWGDSMGGLVTAALAEDPHPVIQGAVSACGSLGGSLTMMNLALDGAFAFVTLQAPDAGIRVVDVDDDRVNGSRVAEALRDAMQTPAGRARVALAAVLAGLPVWTQTGTAAPAVRDYPAQLTQMAATFAASVFPPRTDQERRAQGVNSWNVGVDYRGLLEATGRREWVAHFYRLAHLSLERDLERLRDAPRISARPEAVRYMRAHYEPQGRPAVPLLSLHTVGDGITSAVLQAAYLQRVRGPDRANYRASWVRGAGHCAFSPAEYVAALDTLKSRVQTGQWQAGAAQLNAAAARTSLGPGRFMSYRLPAPGRR
ncbi:MAG TPA: hypothetical protein VMC02_11545 [Steroidobacteraceae bacterium]|nr:hypothetical protein [Steroidobacteraceae bacterium]